MAIERNVIFIYPISSNLEQLKSKLEENGDYMVYDLEAVPEYGQLIGIMDYSITFSCDFKKTEDYLKQSSDFIKTPKASNIYVNEKTVPNHILSKLKMIGLNEATKDDENADQLFTKVVGFFDKFEGIGVGDQPTFEEPVAEKETVDFSKIDKKIGSGLDKDYQKVKSMGSYDMSSGMFSNFVLKTNTTGMPWMKSPFDNIQRKNVKSFTPVVNNFDFKKASFKRPDGMLKKNPFQNLMLKQGPDLNLPGQKKKKLNIPNFDKNKKDYDHKKAMFDVVEKDLKKKKKLFKEVKNELKRRKAFLEQNHQSTGVRKKFDEVYKELKRKKKEFKAVEREFKRKRIEFAEVGPTSPKRKKLELDIIDAVKKNRAIFEEVQKKGPEWKKALEENALAGGLNKTEFPEFDLKAKKRAKFVEAEKQWNSGMISNDQNELDQKKHGTFEEVKKNKKHESISFEENERKKKSYGTFEEVKKKKEFNAIEREQKNKTTTNDHVNLAKLKQIEQILDYSKLLRLKAQGKFNLSEDEEEVLKENCYENDLDEPDLTYYAPKNLGIEYLILYQDLIYRNGIKSEHLIKMIQFALMKEFKAPLSIFLVSAKTESYLDLIPLFEGHKEENQFLNEEEFTIFLRENIAYFAQVSIPSFYDETFQNEENFFVYPFYEEGEMLGIGISHCGRFVHDHIDAKKFELMLMTLKGVIIDEHTKMRGGQ